MSEILPTFEIIVATLQFSVTDAKKFREVIEGSMVIQRNQVPKEKPQQPIAAKRQASISLSRRPDTKV